MEGLRLQLEGVDRQRVRLQSALASQQREHRLKLQKVFC